MSSNSKNLAHKGLRYYKYKGIKGSWKTERALALEGQKGEKVNSKPRKDDVRLKFDKI